MFRAKKLDIGSYLNIKVIRDHTKRKVFAENEPERCVLFSHSISPSSATTNTDNPASRQALRYIIRNTTLPPRARAEAQLQLTQMHCYTRPTQIRGRCLLGGKGRGVFRDFRMSRVCSSGAMFSPGSHANVFRSTTLGCKHWKVTYLV